MDSFAKVLGKTIVLLLAASMAIAATVHAFSGDLRLVGACGALAIFAYLASQVELLDSLSGFGVNAKMKRLDETLGRADDVLDRLRFLAAMFSRAIVDNRARAGRSGINTVRESWDEVVKLRELLRSLGVHDDKIRSALEPWATWLVLDIAFGVGRRCETVVRRGINLAKSTQKDDQTGRITLEAEAFIRERIGNPYLSSVASDYPERLKAMVRDAPLLAEGDRTRLKALVDEVSPVIQEILERQQIPDPERWLDDLQRIRRYQLHGDVLDWRSNSLEGD